MLFNNAGVALLGHFEEISMADFRWLMDINFWGVVYGTAYFLPLLKKEKRAHIVNTSSLLGFFGAAGQSAYCASKFAVRGFTESLHHELLGTNVGVTCVHPGFVRTAIAASAKEGARAVGRIARGQHGAVSEGGAYGARGGGGEDSARRGARSDARIDRRGRVFRGYVAAAEARELLEFAGETIRGSQRKKVSAIATP